MTVKKIDFAALLRGCADMADDDGSKLLINALSDLERKAVRTKILLDKIKGKPVSFTFSIAGNVDNGVFHQGFTIEHDESPAEALALALPYLPKAALIPNKAMDALIRTKTKTFAVLVVGKDADGQPIVLAGWHPDITDAQALAFLAYALQDVLAKRPN